MALNISYVFAKMSCSFPMDEQHREIYFFFKKTLFDGNLFFSMAFIFDIEKLF